MVVVGRVLRAGHARSGWCAETKTTKPVRQARLQPHRSACAPCACPAHVPSQAREVVTLRAVCTAVCTTPGRHRVTRVRSKFGGRDCPPGQRPHAQTRRDSAPTTPGRPGFDGLKAVLTTGTATAAGLRLLRASPRERCPEATCQVHGWWRVHRPLLRLRSLALQSPPRDSRVSHLRRSHHRHLTCRSAASGGVFCPCRSRIAARRGCPRG